jgi:hypothetical protein
MRCFSTREVSSISDARGSRIPQCGGDAMKEARAKAATRSRPKNQLLPSKPAKLEQGGHEDAYRRGFEHGAYLTYECAKRLFATEEGQDRLRHWVELELRQWRLAATGRRNAGASGAKRHQPATSKRPYRSVAPAPLHCGWCVADCRATNPGL